HNITCLIKQEDIAAKASSEFYGTIIKVLSLQLLGGMRWSGLEWSRVGTRDSPFMSGYQDSAESLLLLEELWLEFCEFKGVGLTILASVALVTKTQKRHILCSALSASEFPALVLSKVILLRKSLNQQVCSYKKMEEASVLLKDLYAWHGPWHKAASLKSESNLPMPKMMNTDSNRFLKGPEIQRVLQAPIIES
ncbi:hypothetical protein U0070_019829, partial [Myodes glareolus]